MKLKKYLSLLIAAGMMATSFATVANAATKPTVVTNVTAFDAEDEENVFVAGSYDAETLGIPEGGAAYLIEYQLADINLGLYKSGSTAHNRLGGFEVYYDITNADNIADAFVDYLTAELDPSDPWDDGDVFAVVGPGSNTGFWPTSNLASADYTVEEPTDVLFNFVVVVKDASIPVTFTPVANTVSGGANVKTYIKTVAYNGKSANKSGDADYNYSDTLNVSEIKLGTSAPAEFKFTPGTGMAVTAGDVNGYIIAGNKMENVDKTATYVATFTADNTEAKTSTLKELPEATTFTFDAVLRFKDNKVKENIQINVAAAE